MSRTTVVTIAGQDVTGDVLSGSLTFSWGRSSLDSQPDATTVGAVLEGVAGPELGAEMVVYVYNDDEFAAEPRPEYYYLFRGYITDLS